MQICLFVQDPTELLFFFLTSQVRRQCKWLNGEDEWAHDETRQRLIQVHEVSC